MANNFLAVFDEQFSKITTKNLYNMLVGMALGGKEAHNSLKNKGAGETHNFVSYAKGGVQNAPEYQALIIDDNVGIRESLTADQRSAYTFRLSDDHKQTVGHDFMADRSNDAVMLLKTEIDGEFLYEHGIAANTEFDDGDLDVATNGGAGNAVVLSAINPHEIAVKALSQLRILGGAAMNRPYMVWTPAHFARLEQFLGNTGNNLADNTIVNGYRGKIGGIEMYESTNLTHIFEALFTVNATNGQIFAFNGYTFTFVTAAVAATGEVLIEASLDLTIANLVSAISVDQTVGIKDVKYFHGEDTIALRTLEKNYTSSYDAGSDTLTVAHKRGAVAGLSTDVTGVTLGDIVVQVVMGQMGSLDLAVPKMLHATQERPADGQWTNFLNSIRYGILAQSIKRDLMARILIVA